MGHNFVVSVYTTPGTLVEWYCYVGWTWWLHIRPEASLVFIPDQQITEKLSAPKDYYCSLMHLLNRKAALWGVLQ